MLKCGREAGKGRRGGMLKEGRGVKCLEGKYGGGVNEKEGKGGVKDEE